MNQWDGYLGEGEDLLFRKRMLNFACKEETPLRHLALSVVSHQSVAS